MLKANERLRELLEETIRRHADGQKVSLVIISHKKGSEKLDRRNWDDVEGMSVEEAIQMFAAGRDMFRERTVALAGHMKLDPGVFEEALNQMEAGIRAHKADDLDMFNIASVSKYSN